MRGVSGFLLVVRFLTELALLAGLAVAGERSGGSVLLDVLGAVLWPVLAGVIWALVIAPKAPRRAPEPTRFILEFALFVTAAISLAAAGLPATGLVIAVVGVLTAVAVRVFAKDG